MGGFDPYLCSYYFSHFFRRKKERQKKSKASKAAAVWAAGSPGPEAGTVRATMAAAVQTKAVAAISKGFENVSDDTACGGT